MTRYLSKRLRAIFAVALTLAGIVSFTQAQETNKFKDFSKATIDFGLVAADAESSARFYSDVIGFTEVPGFSVSTDLGKKIGLTDSKAVKVRVFVLGEGNLATRLKLMSFPEAPGKRPDQTFVHSTLGLRYLTLYVSSMDQALARLKKADVKTLGETPIALSATSRLVVVRDPDGNFIELIGP